jgi:hypothetical protein
MERDVASKSDESNFPLQFFDEVIETKRVTKSVSLKTPPGFFSNEKKVGTGMVWFSELVPPNDEEMSVVCGLRSPSSNPGPSAAREVGISEKRDWYGKLRILCYWLAHCGLVVIDDEVNLTIGLICLAGDVC